MLPPAWSWWLDDGKLVTLRWRREKALLVGVDDVCKLDAAIGRFFEVWEDSVYVSVGVCD